MTTIKSTVTKLFDYKQLEIPKEITKWRIPDGEIEKKLRELSELHFTEMQVDVVQSGDCVKCACLNCQKFLLRSVLLYPGKQLIGAAEAENACIGLKKGDKFFTHINDNKVELKITDIRRRTPMPISDQLIQSERIEGVNTVAHYFIWYREQNNPASRKKAAYQIAGRYMAEILKNSQLLIDQQEQDEWAHSRAELFHRLYAVMREMENPLGEKPTADAEEQTMAKLVQESKQAFCTMVIHRYICNLAGIVYGEEDYVKNMEEFAQAQGKTVEEVKQNTNLDIFLAGMYANSAYEILSAEAEQFLED